MTRLFHPGHGLLDRLYETAIHDDAWNGFLAELVEVTRSRSARLLILNEQADEVMASYKTNIDDSAHRDYVNHFVNACPWRPELAHKAPGRLYSTYAHFSCRQAEYYRTEFFNDWARRLDIHHGVCGTVNSALGQTVQLLIQRTRGQGPYSEHETDEINGLIPHLRRVLHLSRNLEAMRLETRAIRRAAQHCPLPFLLLDERGRVRFVSAEADRVIEATPALNLSGERLEVRSGPVSARLKRQLDRSRRARTRGESMPSGSLRIPRPGIPDLHLFVTHLHPDMPELQLVPEPCHTALFLHDPLETPELDRPLLMEIYGLTVSEARIAALIAQGLDAHAIAQRHRIKANTVRMQLKSIFRKTNTHRQSQLVSLLLTGPAHRPRPVSAHPGHHRRPDDPTAVRRARPFHRNHATDSHGARSDAKGDTSARPDGLAADTR